MIQFKCLRTHNFFYKPTESVFQRSRASASTKVRFASFQLAHDTNAKLELERRARTTQSDSQLHQFSFARLDRAADKVGTAPGHRARARTWRRLRPREMEPSRSDSVSARRCGAGDANWLLQRQSNAEFVAGSSRRIWTWKQG